MSGVYLASDKEFMHVCIYTYDDFYDDDLGLNVRACVVCGHVRMCICVCALLLLVIMIRWG